MAKGNDKNPSFRLALSISFLLAMAVILSIAVLFATVLEAEGATTIGITLSKSCLISVNCPTYQELVTLYDNTNQYYSGEFGTDALGNFERQASKFKKHWEFYRYQSQVVIAIDPQSDWIPKMSKHMTIVPTEFTYFEAEDFKVGSFNVTKTGENVFGCEHYNFSISNKCLKYEIVEYNVTADYIERTERHNQSIKNCAVATVHYSVILETINDFLTDCDEPAYDSIEIIQIPLLPYTPNDSPWFKYSQWMAKAQQDCKELC